MGVKSCIRFQQELQPGIKVTLHSLKTAPQLNGQHGVLEMFVTHTARWRVKLSDGTLKDIKPENLTKEDTSKKRAKVYEIQKEEVVQILQEIIKSQEQMKAHIKELTHEILKTGLTFEQTYQSVRAVMTED